MCLLKRQHNDSEKYLSVFEFSGTGAPAPCLFSIHSRSFLCKSFKDGLCSAENTFADSLAATCGQMTEKACMYLHESLESVSGPENKQIFIREKQTENLLR